MYGLRSLILPAKRARKESLAILHFLPILAAICQCLGPSKFQPTKDTSPFPSDGSDDGCPEYGPIADLIALEKTIEEICFLNLGSTLWPPQSTLYPPFSLPTLLHCRTVLPRYLLRLSNSEATGTLGPEIQAFLVNVHPTQAKSLNWHPYQAGDLKELRQAVKEDAISLD